MASRFIAANLTSPSLFNTDTTSQSANRLKTQKQPKGLSSAQSSEWSHRGWSSIPTRLIRAATITCWRWLRLAVTVSVLPMSISRRVSLRLRSFPIWRVLPVRFSHAIRLRSSLLKVMQEIRSLMLCKVFCRGGSLTASPIGLLPKIVHARCCWSSSQAAL